MYRCEKHGIQRHDWCDRCNILLSCDCSELDTARFKDLIFDCNKGECTVTVMVQHCQNCGDVKDVTRS